MSCLADTNVLLRYVQQNHDMHGVAVAALDFLLGSGEIVVIVPQNITEFWNVCTRPTDPEWRTQSHTCFMPCFGSTSRTSGQKNGLRATQGKRHAWTFS